MADKLRPHYIKESINTSVIGREIVFFEKTGSTNTVAKDLASKGAAEGTVVITEEQIAGRGRSGKTWLSEPCMNILMSVIFRPEIPHSKAFTLTMIVSVASVKAIEKMTGLKTMIKWPNDIYCGNRKLAGILTELSFEGRSIEYAVAGIGINVNSDISGSPEIRDMATSIYSETGRLVLRNDLLKLILEEMDGEYALFRDGRLDVIRDDWDRYSLVTGKPVRIIYSEGHVEEGIARSISEDGSLMLLMENGEEKRVLYGEVSLRL